MKYDVHSAKNIAGYGTGYEYGYAIILDYHRQDGQTDKHVTDCIFGISTYRSLITPW